MVLRNWRRCWNLNLKRRLRESDVSADISIFFLNSLHWATWLRTICSCCRHDTGCATWGPSIWSGVCRDFSGVFDWLWRVRDLRFRVYQQQLDSAGFGVDISCSLGLIDLKASTTSRLCVLFSLYFFAIVTLLAMGRSLVFLVRTVITSRRQSRRPWPEIDVHCLPAASRGRYSDLEYILFVVTTGQARLRSFAAAWTVTAAKSTGISYISESPSRFHCQRTLFSFRPTLSSPLFLVSGLLSKS